MPVLLQINSACNYGSTGKIVEQIGRRAINEGWKVYVAHGSRYVNSSQLNTIKIGSTFIENFHGLFYSVLMDRHGLGSVRATKKLIEKIRTIQPDIIHLHNIHGYYINYKLLFEYLRSIDIPVVWTLHDCWSFTGHCCYFDFQGCSKWKTLCQDCPSLRNYPKSFYDNSKKNFILKRELFTSLNSRLYLVPVSYWLEDMLYHSFLKDCKIKTLHNGIDLSVFKPCNVSYKHNNNSYKIIGCASPWCRRKGFYDFLKLRDLLPQDKYTIIMVGLSSHQMETLPKGIIGIEKTQNVEELARLYSEADVFLNTTYEDNYPTVNLEAIACGTPVITYNTGGSPESISLLTGRVVDKGDLDSVVKAIHELECTDREEMRQNCRLHAKSCFNNNSCFEQYLKLYNEILNK